MNLLECIENIITSLSRLTNMGIKQRFMFLHVKLILFLCYVITLMQHEVRVKTESFHVFQNVDIFM